MVSGIKFFHLTLAVKPGQWNELNCYPLPPCLFQPVMYVGHARLPTKVSGPSLVCCAVMLTQEGQSSASCITRMTLLGRL